jgi:hypothetical protein
MTVARQLRFCLPVQLGKSITITTREEELEIEEGRYYLALAYDSVIEALFHGFQGIQGIFIHAVIEAKPRYLYLYMPVCTGAEVFVAGEAFTTALEEGSGVLVALHEVLLEKLGSIRCRQEDSGGIHANYSMLASLFSWKRNAIER